MTFQLSCGFAPTAATPDLVALAEDLGYDRAWCYDSPALYGDVWMALARAADRTSSIGLGTAVLIPSLRHVLVTASAIASLEELAPGRVAIAIGTGFTGRMVLGQRPMPWRDVETYVAQLRALLRGETVDVDGGAVRMIHPAGFAPMRPIETPIVIGANGPKGLAVAQKYGDGVMGIFGGSTDFDWASLLAFGTVLEDGESPGSERALDAAGPGAAVAFHGLYETDPSFVDGLPGGPEWRAQIETEPAATRHLRVHEGHFVELNATDRPFVTGDMVEQFTWTGDQAALRTRVEATIESGVTELLYAPMGQDIPRELRAFAEMAAPFRA
jgi:5,10-methylenetetrahydromethanopterin reductase